MATQARARSRWNIDKVGAVLGGVCAVHCLLTGVALSLLSVAGLGFLASKGAEFAFVGSALALGSWAIVHGVRKHRSWVPSMFFVAGLTSILVSHFVFGHNHAHGAADTHAHVHSSPWTTVCAVLGGLLLLSFHVVNHRMQKACDCGHCEKG